MAELSEDDALVMAVRANAVDKVRALLVARANVAARTPPFGWTALHEAAGRNALEVAAALLEAGAAVDARAQDGETPLHIAAQEGKEEAIRLLVASRCDVLAASEDGETPLHAAVQHVGGKPSLEHLALLLELRADPAARNKEGHDAFACAQLYTNRADEITTVLQRARSLGGTAEADGIASRRQALNEASGGAAEFSKALRVACRKGQVDCVRQLLQWSPEPAIVAQSGLALAAARGHVEVMEALLAARADIHSGDVSVAVRALAGTIEEASTTPLIAAAGEGALKAVRWLLAQRCDPEAAAKDGATALMAAAIKGSVEGASLLLAAHAEVNHQGEGGWTALMVACQAGKADVARQLLDARAQLECNAEGCGPRELAAANGHSELTKLLDVRATLSTRKAKRSTPADSAAGAEDTRDLDALLRELGEPCGAAKQKSKKPGAKAKAVPPEPAPTKVEKLAAKAPAPTAGSKARGAPSAASSAGTGQQGGVEPPAQEQGAGAASEVAAAASAAGGSGVAAGGAAAVERGDAEAQGAQGAGAGARAHGQRRTGRHAEEVGRLQGRLQEIAAERARLDAEELRTRQRLDELGHTGGRGASSVNAGPGANRRKPD